MIWYDKIKIKFEFCFYLKKGDDMPKAAYSEEDRERIRTDLVRAGLELMAKQGAYYQLYQAQFRRVS